MDPEKFKRLRIDDGSEDDYERIKRYRTEMQSPEYIEHVLPSPPPYTHPQRPPSPPLQPIPTTPTIKSLRISTKTNNAYQDINALLRAVHTSRFGDPEARESWWTKNLDDRAAVTTNLYESSNSLLRQAFLNRHHVQK